MKSRQPTALIITLLVLQGFASLSLSADSHAQATPDVYVGVDLSYGDVAEAKAMIDQVSPYTNLFIIGSKGITNNETKLNTVCQYVYEKGLSFIVYTDMPPQIERAWIEHAKTLWDARFLGLYVYDETGGKQLDLFENQDMQRYPVKEADNYTDARNRFIATLNASLNWVVWNFTDKDVQLFSSDYALYWFDYKAGYDTVFAQFGWNYSRQLNIALCRGAATTQNKDWGAIITWTYTESPYIESGPELYNDLVLAYDNGAKYIVVFDGNEGWTGGILEQPHLEALQQFWNYVQNNPRKSNPVSDRTAYVLPDAYGFGFRGPQDRIWGLWQADALALNVSISVKSLLNDYEEKLDIIYDDGLQLRNTYGYSQLIYWESYTLPPPKISILSPEDQTYNESSVPLTFSLDKQVTWVSYSLDGKQNISLSGNSTVVSMTNGSHNITLFANDTFGNISASETITFTVAAPEPEPEPFTVWPLAIAVAVVTVTAVIAGLLFYRGKRRREATRR